MDEELREGQSGDRRRVRRRLRIKGKNCKKNGDTLADVLPIAPHTTNRRPFRDTHIM